MRSMVTPAIHFAVREGHAEAVQILLDAGADPEWNGLHDGSLIVMARERGHARIVSLLEETRDRRGRVPAQSGSHPLHDAITRDDVAEVRRLLDADPSLVDIGNEIGASPLHRAAGRGAHDLVALLLERGANVHAVLSSARGLGGSFWTDLQAIDLAIWDGRPPRDTRIVALLLAHGATQDLTVAAALGGLDQVRRILERDPTRIRETHPSGRRPLAAAIEVDMMRSRACSWNAAPIRTGVNRPREGAGTAHRGPCREARTGRTAACARCGSQQRRGLVR